MKLVLIATGRTLVVGSDAKCVKGTRAGSEESNITIDEIVEPCRKHPEGQIHYNSVTDGIPSFQGYLPEVIGARFIDQAFIDSAIKEKFEAEAVLRQARKKRRKRNAAKLSRSGEA